MIARFILQLRGWQDKDVVFMGDSGHSLGAHDQDAHTLTAMQFNARNNTLVLSEFDDRAFLAT